MDDYFVNSRGAESVRLLSRFAKSLHVLWNFIYPPAARGSPHRLAKRRDVIGDLVARVAHV